MLEFLLPHIERVNISSRSTIMQNKIREKHWEWTSSSLKSNDFKELQGGVGREPFLLPPKKQKQNPKLIIQGT